jgi:8-oxo-dGTP pyrophosphatase MutT (NUDIX family)
VLVDLCKPTFDTDATSEMRGVSKKAAHLDRGRRPAGFPDPSAIPDVYVIVRRADTVLFLLRSGTGYKDGQWGPPSGKVEIGETYREAAARELREETGISASPDQLGFIHVVERLPSSGGRWIGLFFELNTNGASPVNLEPDKHEVLGWFPVSGLPENAVDYVRHVLDASGRGERYSEWRYDAAEDRP